jgi:hypothetical protein
MTDDAPATDDRHPADVVVAMVEHVLGLAATWTRWDGTPAVVPVEGEPPRAYTPHMAVRRVADHLLDHLAEVEARLAGQPTEPDRWHGSMVTTPADLAPFTADDLDEARSRRPGWTRTRTAPGPSGRWPSTWPAPTSTPTPWAT